MKPGGAKPRKTSPALAVTVFLLRILWVLFVVALPLAGVWAASSLAAYSNGPRWAALLAGLCFFPILPLAWEAFAAFRRSREKNPKPRILTYGDRILLRTLGLNLVFLGALLLAAPKVLFTALSARGDWFLEGAKGTWADTARRALFATADRLEWLYLATNENPYRDDPPKPTGSSSSSAAPVPPPVPTDKPRQAEQPDGQDKPIPDPTPTPAPQPESGAKRWPFREELHPAVASIPPEVETSPAAVGKYLAAKEPDPVLRVKALHDYVADRVAYDGENYLAKRYPPQDAETVFSTRKGVCAGYAKLLVAMGEAAGVSIAYVVGVSRDMGGDVAGEGHAWNAALVDGKWYLIDATWDAGYLKGPAFVKEYSTDYLMAPPEVFGANHLPDEPRWQLSSSPISRGDFVRQPNLRPGFHAKGLVLVDPKRSQVTVDGEAVVTLKNPAGMSILADFEAKGAAQTSRCRVTPGETTLVRCDLPAEGTYHVRLFANEAPVGSHSFVGQFEVNRRK
ncbi:transglutaminase domain-containing protein [Polyangium sp. 6x1]|uniref:transglutaminase domain-containing protein n=1 Tax=Polyangium sp. 6x1 TaxID=3042689 RepID=UPI0024828A5D|nr:transglutaminase domain-containing protein [Polyangium sp. 6x1]MDI1446437.1 transglutaminase domain-containing protein [Polyangium sp. 6x1]